MSPKAFENNWLVHAERFYRVAFYLLEDQEEAKDAVQELYLRIWRKDPGAVVNPAAYGITLMKNLCIDRIRHERAAGEESLTPLLEEMAVSEEDPPDMALDGRERLRRIQSVLEGLPENKRKILTMRLIEGLSYKEIAQRTGTRELNARVMVVNFRKQLKENETD